MTARQPIHFADPAVQICPFKAYREARETAPVYQDPDTGHYIVTDYQLVKALAGDSKRLSNRCGILGEIEGPYKELAESVLEEHGYPMIDVLVSGDPPTHSFHRSLVDKVFSAARVRKMESYIQDVVEQAISAVAAAGHADFFSQVAVVVPTTIIADQLGVPRSDIEQFKKWSDAATDRINTGLDESRMRQALLQHCELQNYLAAKAQGYREHPVDCILSDLVHAESNGRRLSISEIVNIASLLIVAGNETTTNALASGMVRLASDAALQEALRDSPDKLPDFIEETLRLDAPIQGLFRRALVDIEIDGITVAAGSILMLRWGAANRDPAVFADADSFDLSRPNKRHHLTFGSGAHFCVGSQLARAELKCVFGTVLERLRKIRIADIPDAVRYHPNYVTYGVEKLLITFDTAK